MNEITKTIVFAVVGLVLVAGAVAVHVVSQPEPNEQFALVGEEFFPEFDSPREVTYLEIAAYDTEKGKKQQFRVEFKDNLWRIPSHHDYPAESPDRLFGTAASVIGIRREALKGRRENEHERFGVIDPTSDAAAEAEDGDAVGVRVTLGTTDGKVLADYIVGKKVETQDMDDEMLREIRGEEEPKPRHYVRRPDEKETYIATITIDASTKFSDWIEPDLLLLEASDLRELVLNDYSFDTKIEEVEVIPNSGIYQQVPRSEKVDGDSYTLTRDSDFGSWKLEGLNEETEELITSKISGITSALDNFKILGVRPRWKFDGKNSILTPDLVLEFPESIRTQSAAQRAIQELAMDLESKGFNLAQNREDGALSIASDHGELTASTKDGVVYRLYFGRAFEGTDTEIEIGGAVVPGEEKRSKDPEADSSETEEPDNSATEDDAKSDKKKSRFLLVRVEFDPAFVGDKPTPPVEPVKPEKPAAAEAGSKPSPDHSDKDAAPIKENPPASDADPQPGKESGASESGCDDAAPGAPSTDSGDSPPASGSASASTADGDTPDEKNDTPPAVDENGEKKGDVDEPNGSDDEPDVEKEEKPDDPEAAYQEAMSKYELDMLQYEQDKKQYEQDLKEYEDKLAKSKEKVARLNERFGDWYYVISAESIENLRISRSDLVRKKEKKEEDNGTSTPSPLGLPELPDLPGETDGSSDPNSDATDSAKDEGEDSSNPPESTKEGAESGGSTPNKDDPVSDEVKKDAAEPSPAEDGKPTETDGGSRNADAKN